MPEVERSDTHEHFFQPAGILMQAREHVVNNQPMSRPSLVMLCGCGTMQHWWVPAPEEPPERRSEATQQALRQGRKPGG